MVGDDFIGVWENRLSALTCQRTIEAFELASERGFTNNRQVDENAKKSDKDDEVVYDSHLPADTLHPSLCHELNEAIWGCYREYADVYSIALTENSESHFVYSQKIQRTNKGQGYHRWHHEAGSKPVASRLLAYTIYLNDVDEGGETEFLYQSKRVKPTVGTVCIFPAAFTHTHRGNPPLSNTKYIVTGWFEY